MSARGDMRRRRRVAASNTAASNSASRARSLLDFARCALAVGLSCATTALTTTASATAAPALPSAARSTAAVSSPNSNSSASASQSPATAPAPVGGSALPTSLGATSIARVRLAPTTAAIGDSIEISFEVEHPAGAIVTWPDPATLPRSFAFLDALGTRRELDATDPGREVSRVRWHVMALEGGEIEWPSLPIVVQVAGANETTATNAAKLSIEHALKPDENQPRPLQSFRPTPAAPVQRWRGLVAGLASLVALAIGWLVVRRLRRRAPVVAAHAPVLARLADLDRRAHDEPARAREIVYALTCLLREAVDTKRAATLQLSASPITAAQHVASQSSTSQPVLAASSAGAADSRTGGTSVASRASLTDADWIADVSRDELLPAAVRSSCARILSTAERWKYGAESPSPLGLRETLSDARAALEALENAPANVASGDPKVAA